MPLPALAGTFSEPERRHLLASRGLGPRVVQRLEGAGVASLAALRQRGVEPVIEQLCRSSGSPAWRNRRRALEQALAAFGGG